MINFKIEKGLEVYVRQVIEKLKSESFYKASFFSCSYDQKYTIPSTITGQDILDPLINTTTEFIRVGTYTQKWIAYKFCPVNAYVDASGRSIFLNTRNLSRNKKEIEETIWHELVHVSDSINRDMVYWHGDNKLAGKSGTAPVKFAKWAINWS